MYALRGISTSSTGSAAIGQPCCVRQSFFTTEAVQSFTNVAANTFTEWEKPCHTLDSDHAKSVRNTEKQPLACAHRNLAVFTTSSWYADADVADLV